MADRKLELLIVVDDAGAKTKLAGVDQAFDKTTVSATKLSSRVGESLTNTLLRFAGPAVIGYAIKSTIQWADSMEEMSQATGINTTRLQQLTYAATQSGTTFDNLVTKIGFLNDKIGNADTGTATALKKLGLGFKDLANLSPDQQLMAIAKAMNQSSISGQELTTVFRDLFGRGGERLIPMFKDLNTLMGDAPTLMDGQVRALARLSDAWDTFWTRLKVGFAETLSSPARLIGAIAGSPMAGTSAQMWLDLLTPGTKPTAPGSPALARMGLASVALSGAAFETAQIALTDQLKAQTAQWEKNKRAAEVLEQAIYATVPKLAQAEWFPWSGRGIESYAPMQWWQGTIPGTSRNLQDMALPALPTQSYGYPVQYGQGGGGGGIWGGLKSTVTSDQFKSMALGYGVNMLQGWSAEDPTSKTKGALSGAAQGAMAGAAFGPWGAAIGGIYGGISGLIGAQSAKRKTEKEADAEIQALQVGLLATYGSIDAIREAGGAAGEALAGAWGDKNIAGLAHFKSLTEQFTTALEKQKKTESDIAEIEGRLVELRATEIPGWQEMQSIAEKYGIDIKDLGQNFKQLRTTDLSMGIVNDFERLVKGGADASAVVKGMSEEISGVVQDSLKFKTEIPENMRPMIQSLIDNGLLLDENKKKITDIGTLKFGESVKTDAELLRDSIGELVSKLDELIADLRGVSDAAGEIPKTIDTTVITHHREDWGEPGEAPIEEPMQHGGIVRRPTRILAGEAGPEAIIPLSRAGHFGGVTVGDIHIHGDVDTPRRARELADRVASQIQAQLLSGRRRATVEAR